MGHFGFSYMGLLFLIMLFVPNIIWMKNKPIGYTASNENRVLIIFEKTGQICVTCAAIFFSDFNLHQITPWICWLLLSMLTMVMYELWWFGYFRSKRNTGDFYSSFLGIPVAGATLPVVAFFLLGIYGKVIWMVLAVLLLGIGHIGIHLQHKKETKAKVL